MTAARAVVRAIGAALAGMFVGAFTGWLCIPDEMLEDDAIVLVDVGALVGCGIGLWLALSRARRRRRRLLAGLSASRIPASRGDPESRRLRAERASKRLTGDP